ncbi:MAG: hypothetical protein BCS36_00145 [Desulfovibrio sp. MES5]|nr:MAG: hypothetical protein BCS36_00145 [Desulfovibrio sp. MES5]
MRKSPARRLKLLFCRWGCARSNLARLGAAPHPVGLTGLFAMQSPMPCGKPHAFPLLTASEPERLPCRKPRLYLFSYSAKNSVPHVCIQSLACRWTKTLSMYLRHGNGIPQSMTLLCRVRAFTIFKKVKYPDKLYLSIAAAFIDVSHARW